MSLHDKESGARIRLQVPQGHTWSDVIAVGDHMVIAATTIADPLTPLQLNAITAGPSGWIEPVLRPLSVPPLPGARPYDVAITAQDTHALLIVDLGQTEAREHLFAVPTTDAGPTRVWPLPAGRVHASGIAAAPDNQVVLTVVGAHHNRQRRQVLRCRLSNEPLLAGHTLLAQDYDRGIHQIYATGLSPDGSLLAIAHTSAEGAVFTVSVTDLDQDHTRVVWQRPCSIDDSAFVYLSFDRTGRHLLFSYGDLISIDLAHHTHRLLASPGADRWLRAAG